MEILNLVVENQATMVLLNDWLDQARGRDQERLSSILEAVREEVVFEMNLAEDNGSAGVVENGALEPDEPSGQRL